MNEVDKILKKGVSRIKGKKPETYEEWVSFAYGMTCKISKDMTIPFVLFEIIFKDILRRYDGDIK